MKRRRYSRREIDMLKKLASDALGLSDIGKIITPEDYDKTVADDYVRYEDGEKIYFLIKTMADEYCFTNLALIHVDGQSATSTKKTMKRYPYYQYPISNVLLETAGRIDLDIEIKFNLGEIHFSIDVHKNQSEQLKDLYKALLFIEEKIKENQTMLDLARRSLDLATHIFQSSRLEGINVKEEFQQMTEYSFSWLEKNREKYVEKDFGYVFEKYIVH